jgi:hypothetical protein
MPAQHTETPMTKPLPDTDPLKREPNSPFGDVPDNEVGEAGRPAGKPREPVDPPTGDKHRPIPPGHDDPTKA